MHPHSEFRKRPITFYQTGLLLLLLLLPIIAIVLSKLLDWRLLAGYLILVSGLSYWTMASDKKKALSKDWRIPESQLHILEIIGGWPGSFLAQCRFRHKNRKLRYQLPFWVIVGLYQYLAVELLTDWSILRSIYWAF